MAACLGHRGPGETSPPPRPRPRRGVPRPAPGPWRRLGEVRPDRCSPRGQPPAAGDSEAPCPRSPCPTATVQPRGAARGGPGQVCSLGRGGPSPAAARPVGVGGGARRRPQGSLARRQRARRGDPWAGAGRGGPGAAGPGGGGGGGAGRRAQVGRELQAVGGGALAVT